jgi:hypothetical protein
LLIFGLTAALVSHLHDSACSNVVSRNEYSNDKLQAFLARGHSSGWLGCGGGPRGLESLAADAEPYNFDDKAAWVLGTIEIGATWIGAIIIFYAFFEDYPVIRKTGPIFALLTVFPFTILCRALQFSDSQILAALISTFTTCIVYLFFKPS